MLCLSGISGMRTLLRIVREKISGEKENKKKRKRVAIIGAGNRGARLQNEIRSMRGLGLEVVCFFDDDPRKKSVLLHGVPVLGQPEGIKDAMEELGLSKAIIAMPNASATRIREVVNILNDCGLDNHILPSFSQTLESGASVLRLRHVEIEDLLGREPVRLDTNHISEMVRGKVLLVTGAGGSIGSELSRQIASYQPEKLILFERCEAALFLIEQELLKSFPASQICAFPADINDSERVREAFLKYQPKIIFHAAAHKHVPMMESHPSEAVFNNLIGTRTIANLSQEYGAERFVLISSDKAVRPTNVMGATKRMAEIYIQGLQEKNNGTTKFMAVRFGNVLGSSGSVIPIFRKQIAEGGPVTVTHPDVTRYFMTIPEAVGLVLQCGSEGWGGDVFVLDMGDPIRIVDVAKQLIELSGLRPELDIAIEFTGLRPGEKMSEELNYENEVLIPTHHPKVRKMTSKEFAHPDFDSEWNKTESGNMRSSESEMKNWIKKLVPEYSPKSNVS